MNTTELLVAAKSKIDSPEKWTQRVYAKDSEGNSVNYDDPSATCYCSLGAIFSAADAMDLCGSTQEAQALTFLDSSVGHATILWLNDHKPHEEVMKVWDKAIELSKKR